MKELYPDFNILQGIITLNNRANSVHYDKKSNITLYHNDETYNVIVDTNILESNLHDIRMCIGERQFV